MSDLVRNIEALAGTPVMCVGDVMLDRFVYGSVERISPEAPVPVLRIERHASMLGGAGNVAGNLESLGCLPRFLSVVGDDEAGSAILRRLVEARLADSCHMVTEHGRQTSEKTRFFAQHQHLLRTDSETVADISAESQESLLAAARALLPEVSAVILSDYGKGVLTAGVIQALIAAAKAAGKPVIVDPKGSDYRRYRGADLVTPNRRELAQASGLPVISTPVGSIPEIVADGVTGLLVEPRDVDALKTAMTRLLRDDGLRDRLGAAALVQARERFSASRMLDRMEAIFRQVLEEP